MYYDQQLLSFEAGAGNSGDMALPWTQAGDPYEGAGADMGSIRPHLGDGEKVKYDIRIVVQPVGVGASLEFELVEADNAALTTNPVVLRTTDPIAITALPVGTLIDLTVPINKVTKRYIGLRALLTGADLTAGEVQGGVVLDHQTNRAGFAASTGYGTIT